MLEIFMPVLDIQNILPLIPLVKDSFYQWTKKNNLNIIYMNLKRNKYILGNLLEAHMDIQMSCVALLQIKFWNRQLWHQVEIKWKY